MRKAFCIGEVLFDIIGDEHCLGGAPLNVAAQLSRLGVNSYIVSAVGEDFLGKAAAEKIRSYGINARFLKTDPAHKTGTAVVRPELDGNERFELPENAAYDFIVLNENELCQIAALRPDAVVFGSLAQKRSEVTRKSVISLLNALPNAEKLFDVNLRKAYFDRDLIASSIDKCTVFKLNDSETEIISPMLFGRDYAPAEFARRLFCEFSCGLVLVTMGKNGAAVYSRDGRSAFSPTPDAPVDDTVGAGDAFSAGFLASWLGKHDMEEALREGNAAGARTVAHRGALPE